MNPLNTQQFINAAHDDRIRAEMERSFGAGATAGDSLWEPPVHAATKRGRPVTVSFGRGKREGQTLICDGHVGMAEFYGNARTGKGHDHYLTDGTIASKHDRGKFSG